MQNHRYRDRYSNIAKCSPIIADIHATDSLVLMTSSVQRLANACSLWSALQWRRKSVIETSIRAEPSMYSTVSGFLVSQIKRSKRELHESVGEQIAIH